AIIATKTDDATYLLLLFKISCKVRLTNTKLLLQIGEYRLECFLIAIFYNIWAIDHTFQDIHETRMKFLEPLGVLWQLLTDIIRPEENIFQIGPRTLHVEQQVCDRFYHTQLVHP